MNVFKDSKKSGVILETRNSTDLHISTDLLTLLKTNNSMIGKNLNPKGESVVCVFINRGTPDESEKFHKELCSRLMDAYYPSLVGWLTLQEVDKKIHECKTIEEIEQLKVNCVPEDMFADLISLVNAEEDLNDEERLYTLAHVGDRIVFSAVQHVQTSMQQRAEAIARKPKNKIIV